MLFFSTILAASAIAAASPLSARQSTENGTQAVIDALNQSGVDLVALNQTLNTFEPKMPADTLTALQIQNEAKAIANDLQNAVYGAKNITEVQDDSTTLAIATVVSDLVPNITSVLNNIVVHKPAFVTGFLGFGDLSKTVEADLVQQQDLVGELGAALQPVASPDYAYVVPLLTEQVQGLFNQSIAAYQNCTGSVCLPPLTNL